MTLPGTEAADVRPHDDTISLIGRLMCYHCRHSFRVPAHATKRYTRVKCPHCGEVEPRDQYKAHFTDPLRHPLGWPYDDPTVAYDC